VRILTIGPKGIAAEYTGNDLSILKKGARNIHWCPEPGIQTDVFMPDGSVISGRTEQAILETASEIVQFERFGFVRVEKKVDDGSERLEVKGEREIEVKEGEGGRRRERIIGFFSHK
jgi:hypothetical protein